MIELDHVTKRYGDTLAVDDLSLAVGTGELCVIIGTSGSGKSTTLRMINRLIAPSHGSIRIAGIEISRFKVEDLRRRIGYVIQNIGLFPHWTIARNVGAVPELMGWPATRIAERTAELLTLLKLDPATFLHQYPHQLSIGQQQRVGIARALAAEPDMLLMDEPFGALDPITRDALQSEIVQIQRASRKTVVFVTHDMDEALKLASRIAIMDRGRLVQVGTPLELLASPANEFVHDFVGRDDAGIKRLSIETVATRLRPDETVLGQPIGAEKSLRHALSQMIERRTDRLAVIDADGRPLGAIHLTDLVQR
jgi:osmoprotectant transport system ATP-binding protein